MPVFAVELSNPSQPLEVKLNKLPKQGSWFDLGDGTPAQVKIIRMVGGEPVIFAMRGTDKDKNRLKRSKRELPRPL